ANAAVSRAEQARAFVALVADTTASSPFVTPTLKLQRDAFLSAASTHIETLYTTRRTP
ncbi:MAG TPA: long-chain fatty acid--CoA ligase, partial [Propionibacterium sp.]|nr:long-chain fatty acid--CoA ligase [Propionibacterium sp.]